MNNTNLEEQLAAYRQDYDPWFSTRVMARIQAVRSNRWSWSWLNPALGLAAVCLALLWVQDGTLSMDALLGIAEYDTSLDTYLMYF